MSIAPLPYGPSLPGTQPRQGVRSSPPGEACHRGVSLSDELTLSRNLAPHAKGPPHAGSALCGEGMHPVFLGSYWRWRISLRKRVGAAIRLAQLLLFAMAFGIGMWLAVGIRSKHQEAQG